jgi:hypothetical protein
LGTTVANQISIQEEIKGRLNSGNSCYSSVQNLLTSHLLSKNIKIKIYKIVISLFCMGVKLMEERRLGVFENRVLRRIFGVKRDEVMREWRNCITRSFVICALRQV